MAAPSINGNAVPSSMSSRGAYKFERQSTERKTGEGDVIKAGPQRVTWVFRWMTQTELDFWITTLLSGGDSAAITTAELWDDTWTAQTFTSGYLYRPTWEEYRGGLYWGVTVVMDHLLPIV